MHVNLAVRCVYSHDKWNSSWASRIASAGEPAKEWEMKAEDTGELESDVLSEKMENFNRYLHRLWYSG
jgi:hypothetical protein